jgi:hypothetical protein
MMDDPGVGGTDVPTVAENGVEGVKRLLPPHLEHFALSAEPGKSDDRLFRRPLRFG